MDLVNHVPSCRLLCPKERYEKEKDSHKMINVNGQIVQFKYRFVKSSYFNENSDNIHSLFHHNNKNGRCEDCGLMIKTDTSYFCRDCQGVYHKECVESPSIYHSSAHPKHPLQLLWRNRYSYQTCFSCHRHIGWSLLYYCFVCEFALHVVCSREPTPLAIDNPKRHRHTLHYFPRKSTLPCDVCGLVDKYVHKLYACLICDFLVHKSCIDLPYVIKVTRHSHRLAFTPGNAFKESVDCGVCYQKIDINYGEYSCVKGCVYAMHSMCALRSDVSDGKELEGEPEETYEDTKMFEDKGDGVILHEAHHCHDLMKREKQLHDENKHCQACMLPFCEDGNVYCCTQYCDFILHESCAYIPRVKQFMLHVHPLILDLRYTTSCFTCIKCRRDSCGFAYVCPITECGNWKLDTLCASICEPFNYHSHPHPLFITCTSYNNMWCDICELSRVQPLNCVECGFVLCFRCATLPHKARYNHDEHLLVFLYKKDTNDDDFYWCEICEEDIFPRKGFYACNECGVTLHVDCLIGRDLYMKAGQNLVSFYGEETIQYLSNTYHTRPICKTCGRHCPYKIKVKKSIGDLFCSTHCYKERRLLKV